MQVTSLLRYSSVCPFLGHSTPSTLRSLASSTANNNVSVLTATAIRCPMMGPKLAAIAVARAAGAEIGVRGYASVAGSKEVEEIHKVSLKFFRCGIRISGLFHLIATQRSNGPGCECMSTILLFFSSFLALPRIPDRDPDLTDFLPLYLSFRTRISPSPQLELPPANVLTPKRREKPLH